MRFRGRNVQGLNFNQPTKTATWKHPPSDFWLILRDSNGFVDPERFVKKNPKWFAFTQRFTGFHVMWVQDTSSKISVFCGNMNWTHGYSIWFLDEFPHFGEGPHLWCSNFKPRKLWDKQRALNWFAKVQPLTVWGHPMVGFWDFYSRTWRNSQKSSIK